MVCLCFILFGIFVATYFLFDLTYFAQIALLKIWRYIRTNKKKRLNQSVRSYGFCTTNDVDISLTQMNKAKFIRKLEFARLNFYERTGLHRAITSRGGTVHQTSTSIQYSKSLPIFTFYFIETRLVYWEQNVFYFEHKFMTIADRLVRAVVIDKQEADHSALTLPEAIGLIDPELEKPEPEEHLKLWINWNEASSRLMKKLN